MCYESMVPTHLVFPPLDRVSLAKVSKEDSGVVAVLSLLEDLMMQVVVAQPAALLKEQTEEQGGREMHRGTVRVVDHGASRGPHGNVEEALVEVV